MTLIVLLIGCAPAPDGPGLSEVERQGGCTLYVPEMSVDFGAVSMQQGSVEHVFRLRNDGDAECVLSEVALSAGSQDLTLEYDNPYPLQPGQIGELYLSYSPTQNGPDHGTLRILSNDPQSPVVEVPIQGLGEAPSLTLALQEEPESVYLGCVQERVLVALNQGDEPLRLDSVALNMGPDFAWTEQADLLRAQLPVELEPGESLLFGLRFEPHSLDGAQEGAIQVQSNDPEEPVRVLTLKGTAEPYAEHKQSTELPLQRQTDLLIVLDWSSSEDQIRALSTAFPTFRAALEAENLDYHLAVVVEDTGCVVGGQGPIHSGLSAEAQWTRFETQSCTTAQGPDACPGLGRYIKSAFTLASNAASMENTSAGGCNEGLFRDNAELHILSVSNQSEESLESTAVHLARLQALRDRPENVVLHGLGGLPPSGCENAEFYDRYFQATELSGGIFRDYCDPDMATHLQAFAQAVVPTLDPFALEAPPIPETLVVLVDGEEMAGGWSLDLKSNALSFDVEPAPGSAVEIRYTSAPEACEPAP